MKICVTGGCGFIGGELIKSLNNLGFTDIIIVDKPQLKRKDIKYKKILDYDNLDFKFLNNINFVFHLGENSSLINNYDFTSKLIIECHLKNIYVVFASSSGVYGSDRRIDGIKPLTEHGKSKLLTEKFVSFLPHHNVVCLRYHYVYGASEDSKGDNASVVNKWISDYKSGVKEINLFNGSDNIFRDFVFVDDINEINILFMDYFLENNSYPDNKIYDVGTGVPISFEKLAQEIVKITGQKIKYINNPYNKTNYQFYTKAKTKDIKKIYRDVYGKIFRFTRIGNEIKKVIKNIQ